MTTRPDKPPSKIDMGAVPAPQGGMQFRVWAHMPKLFMSQES
jgi:hypothetical protein